MTGRAAAGLGWLSVVALLMLTVVPVDAASSGPVLDQVCAVEPDAFDPGVVSTDAFQRFTPALKQIDAIEIRTEKRHQTTGTLERISLERDGTTLHSWNPDTSATGWMRFDLPTAEPTTPGETLTIKATVGIDYFWNFCGTRGSDNYPGGEATVTDTDFMFRTWAPADSQAPDAPSVSARPTTIGSVVPTTPADLTWAAEISLGADDIFPTQDVTLAVLAVDTDTAVRTETLTDLAEDQTHTWPWDGNDDAGHPAPTGDYRFTVNACDRVPPDNGTPNCTPDVSSQSFTRVGVAV